MPAFFRLYLLDMILVWGACGVYYLYPFAHLGSLQQKEFGIEVLLYLAIAYSIVALYTLYHKAAQGESTKADRIREVLLSKKSVIGVKNDLLFMGVKFFFIPLMVPSTIAYGESLLNLIINFDSANLNFIALFNERVFPILVQLVMVISLAYYSFGYLIESKKLDSSVRSVEPSLFGWLVCLVCYVPFYTFLAKYVPMYTHDLAYFYNDTVTFIVRLVLIVAMSYKIWAISVLGAKCSNLTNRGIVTAGPYKHVRHPHYVAKLSVWWITLIPAINNESIGTSWEPLLYMLLWTLIYGLRAYTEEQHLLSDKDYQSYYNKVKYRFIPGLY